MIVETLFNDILKVSQIIVIPAGIIFYRSLKKQINKQRDISDLRKYVILICEKLGIDCVLEKS